MVDISNTTSTGKFVEAVEDAILGSNIKTSMDTDGNVFFRRDDGGQIVLQSFTSATGKDRKLDAWKWSRVMVLL